MYKLVACIAALLAMVAGSIPAAGYAVSAVDGKPIPNSLRWPSRSIEIAISSSLAAAAPNIKSDSDVEGAIRRSIQAWELVADVKFTVAASPKLNASPAGRVGDGVSLITIAPTAENSVVFAKDPESLAATTRIFYNGKGVITEADIVLNPYQQFSTDGTFGTFDLESTLTHELGHLLGLDHSAVLGSTMSANYGKNGVYNLHNYHSRTLSVSDIAAVRALYGPGADSASCCGSLKGRIYAGENVAADASVWIENAESGVIFGRGAADAEGIYTFAGLPPGSYRVFAERSGAGKADFAAREIGVAEVGSGESIVPTRSVNIAAREAELSLIGFNGQLAELSVLMNPGRSYKLFLAGSGLDLRRVSIGFSSPYIAVVPGSMVTHGRESGLDVVSFDVTVDAGAPLGEYAIHVEWAKGRRAFLTGAVTIDSFANPFILASADPQ